MYFRVVFQLFVISDNSFYEDEITVVDVHNLLVRIG